MNSSSAARALEAGNAQDSETAEIHALLKIEGHPISLETAALLKTKIEQHQPSALAYLEARLIHDSMGGRFTRTRALLRALEQDAVNDGAAVYKTHPDDKANPAQPDYKTVVTPRPRMTWADYEALDPPGEEVSNESE